MLHLSYGGGEHTVCGMCPNTGRPIVLITQPMAKLSDIDCWTCQHTAYHSHCA